MRGILKQNESLARYTSWRVGGKAQKFYKPANLEDLASFLQTLPETEELVWLGLGSNVLVRDGGIRGTVIYTLACLAELSLIDSSTIRAEAGVTCAKLAKFCAKSLLTDSAFFAGIPGTVGGALAMNAGAYGDETWRHVIAVEMINRRGEISIKKPEEFKVSYREVVKSQEEWFVAGHFRFPSGGEVGELNAAIKKLLHQRSEQQPIGELNCGSVFRNPEGNYAARLIESCGLKGKRIGNARVSEKHANFIINDGGATAEDIERLINFIIDEVERVQKIRLQREVHIIGEKLNDK